MLPEAGAIVKNGLVQLIGCITVGWIIVGTTSQQSISIDHSVSV
jgi:hypothetical protein